MSSEYKPLSCKDSSTSLVIETSECFICRDGELRASDPLRNFCDCKQLLAHHACLSTWIQRGCRSEDSLRCIICKAETLKPNDMPLIIKRMREDMLKTFDPDYKNTPHGSLYQLQRSSPWRCLTFQWQTWLVLIPAVVLMGLVPYVVHCLMTAFTNPPPHITFKVAAVSFGFLSELLLIMCLSSYLSRQYRQAEQKSFTVWPRSSEEQFYKSDAASASSATSAGQGEDKKVDVLKSGHLGRFN